VGPGIKSRDDAGFIFKRLFERLETLIVMARFNRAIYFCRPIQGGWPDQVGPRRVRGESFSNNLWHHKNDGVILVIAEAMFDEEDNPEDIALVRDFLELA
jgi:hypothetical protein